MHCSKMPGDSIHILNDGEKRKWKKSIAFDAIATADPSTAKLLNQNLMIYL